MRSTAWAIGILSAAILAYEIALMRVLSIIQWYHFAYMIISVALLGVGASGTFLSLFLGPFTRNFESIFGLCIALCAVTMALSFFISQHIPFAPYLLVWQHKEVLHLAIFYLILFIPFFLGATAIGLAFVKYRERIGRLYFANLLGSGLGGAFGVILMFLISPVRVPIAISGIAIVAAALVIPRSRCFSLFTTLSLLLGVLLVYLFGIANPIELRVSEYKSLSKALLLPGAEIILEKSSPLGMLQVIKSPALRHAPGLSLAFTGEVPHQLGVFKDGEWLGAIVDQRESDAIFLDYTTSALPYALRRFHRALVIGAGTGEQILLAQRHRVHTITGVELDPLVIELVQEDFSEETKSLYNQRGIHAISGEGRAFLAKSKEKYDLISIPILEGLSASSAGMYALYENYLLTVKSFSLMLRHLNRGGMIAISTWTRVPPRNSIKLLATLREAMEQNGIFKPDRHILALRGWGTATIVAKQTPFEEGEINAFLQFCKEKYFDPIIYPGMRPKEANQFHQLERPLFFEAAVKVLSEERGELYQAYPFRIAPATDNQPYFYHLFKWKSLPYLVKTFGQKGIPFLEWGYLILILTLLQISLLSLILIILPLLFLRRKGPVAGRRFATFLYFGGIGIGFLSIEMLMIQRFALFLSHPIFAVTTVITGMLTFSGIGSLVSQHLEQRFPHLVPFSILTIAVLCITYLFILPPIFAPLISLPLTVRVIISSLFLAPISFCMGFPFPLGLRRLSIQAPQLVPWAWGINGCFSVMSTALATIVAIDFGYAAVSFIAAGSYGIAAVANRYLPIHKPGRE